MDARFKADEAALQKYADSVKQWGFGVSTPHEMRTLIERIVSGKAGTPASSDEMHRLLNHQFKDSGIASQIPPSVVVASKSGNFERSQSDMAVVHSPSGTYALTIFIKDVDDAKQRGQAIQAISRAVWRHYHPTDRWEPPAGVAKYWSR